MTSPTDPDLNLDLHFLPAWAKEPSNRNLYVNYEGQPEERGRRRGDQFGRRREGLPSERRGPRPDRPERGPEPRRREGAHAPESGARGPRRREDDRGRGRPQREARPVSPPEPLPNLKVSFTPDEKGVDSLARQIRMTGRAYPLFQVAQMILAKPERYSVTLSVVKNADGQVLQPLYLCALDDTLWLSEEEAVDHVLNRHFETFYRAEKTPVEPPKGTYTFVAQCGISGVILGPPNHHDYQNQLRRLHAERFPWMPFEVFKSRVRIVRDEAVVKQWIESQSWRTEYECLNMPEPLRLTSMEEVERHFREHHLPVIVQAVESHTLRGSASRSLRCRPLHQLVRRAWEDQRRFPLQTATVLSQQFAARGLQFFKVNKNVTHVAVARPHYLDLESEPVSDSVRRIVTFINEHPKCTRRQLIEALVPQAFAPGPAPAAPVQAQPPTVSAPAPGKEVIAPAEAKDAPGLASAETPVLPPSEGAASAAAPAPAEPASVPAASATVVPAPVSEPPPEVTALVADLHWLIHQGHVIEFADGVLETAKKPVPRPPRPAPAPVSPSAAKPVAEPVAAEAGASVSEQAPAAQAEQSLPELSGEAAPPQPPESEGAETSPEAAPEPAAGSDMAAESPTEPVPLECAAEPTKNESAG